MPYDQRPQRLDIWMKRGDTLGPIEGQVEGDVTGEVMVAAMKRNGAYVELDLDIGAYDAGEDETAFTVTGDAAEMATLALGRWSWDLEWTAGILVATLVAGVVHIGRDVVGTEGSGS